MLKQSVNLRASAEFRLVYERGRRFDGSLMTVFVLETGAGKHRLGVTASRKLAKQAVQRNRAKRLLRESFRLSNIEMCQLSKKYDWVINARRSLLVLNLEDCLNEFKRIISQLKEVERSRSAETSIS